MEKSTAIILTHGMLATSNAKTCHGLLRGTERFDVLAVIDYQHAGSDAGEVMDGKNLGIPVFASVAEYKNSELPIPKYCVVGVALHGGMLPEDFREELYTAIGLGMGIVCGLHTFLSDDPYFKVLAEKNRVELIDVRKPKPRSTLRFWTGDIYSVKTPKLAVLGTDCALGKRTTCRMLMESCRKHDIATEMIFTGQTGWMQGYRYGFIFDSTVNDFVSGEIERVIVDCANESNPDLILIEGQSALRNPNGPCGSEIILSGNVTGVILQHAPGRRCYDSTDIPIPLIASEIGLLSLYGARVLAITLNEENMTDAGLAAYQRETEATMGIPVLRPLKEGVDRLIPVVREFMAMPG